MSRPVALLDACVLYPQMLRDVLITLACSGFFQAKWTTRINNEWVRHLLAKNPGREQQISRTLELLTCSVEDWLIEDYDHLIETVILPDSNDRHVLAAAIHASVDCIVTLNLADFPATVLQCHGIVVQSPDTFLTSLIENAIEPGCASVGSLRKRYRNPEMTPEQFLDSLSRKGLHQTVSMLRQRIDLI
ncbi:MAG: PIN domain-containing protein [bacterium]